MIRKLNASEEVLITRGGKLVESITTNVVMLALAEKPIAVENWDQFSSTSLSPGVYKAMANFDREYAESKNGQISAEAGLREYANKVGKPIEDLYVFLFGDSYRVLNLPDEKSRLVRVRVDQNTTAPLSRFLKNIGVTARRLSPSVPEALGSIEDRLLLGTVRRLTVSDNGNIYYGVDEKDNLQIPEYDMLDHQYSQRTDDCC